MVWADRCRAGARRVLLLSGLLALTGCVNPVTDFLIEQPLGKLAELAINLQFPMERDPLLVGYVNQLGQEQRALVARSNVPYRFRCVAIEAPNAFAIPYGGVYVTRGLLRFADSEDEIAFVMGHEIGHVERRHSSLAFQRNMLIGLGLSLVTSNNTENWMQFAWIGNQLLDLHWSRENEHSADQMGAMFAIDSGYNPYQGLDFFTRLDEKYGATPRFFSYLQTHPINRDRIALLLKQPQLDDDDPVTLTTIGDGYRARERYTSAAEFYQRALAADADYGRAHLGLARVAAWSGDVRVAREHYLEALRHGVEADVVDVEMQGLPENATPREREVILASADDVTAVRRALDRLDTDVTAIARLADEAWDSPLDAMPALVNGYQASGSMLDQLHRTGEDLPRSVQDLVVQAQKLRAMSATAAMEISGAQTEAELTLQMIEDNRRRINERLAAQPTADELAVAQAVVLDSRAASEEVREAAASLNEVVPVVEDAVRTGLDSIALLHREVTGRTRSHAFASAVAAELRATEDRLRRAIELSDASMKAAYDGRVRALQSSIDITMVDRPYHQRAAARAIVQRFMAAEPQELDSLVDSGFSFGEATFVLGMAKSAHEETDAVRLRLTDRGVRQTVDRLARMGIGSAGNVAIMLKLVDQTLKDEFEANKA